MSRFLLSLTAAAVLMGASPALAEAPGFQPLPTLSKGHHNSKLKLRVVKYDGGTNGGMVVEVRNDSRRSEAFHAKGLYFVPAGNPEAAPQRLGAAGPFMVLRDDRWQNLESLSLAPNETTRLKLQVFCIDSHRSSPSAATKFGLANKRLPKQLRNEIEKGTKRILRAKKAKHAAEASSDVQSHVWETRNKSWIKLEGERKQEKTRRNDLRQRRRSPNRTNLPMPQEQVFDD